MAGITHLEEMQEPALRGLVDESVALHEENPTFGARFLPNEDTFSTKFAYDIVKTNKYLAAMIGYGAETPIVDREAVANKMGELAKIGIKDIVTEEELLALNQSRSNAEKSALVEKLQKKAVDISRYILDRIDVMKLQAIAQGEFHYNQNNVKIDFDFGVPNEHKVVLTGTNAWTNVDHDALGDLIQWSQQYENANNRSADVILMPREVFTLLTKNKSFIAEARPTSPTADRISKDEVNIVLEGYGLPTIEVVKNRKVTFKNLYTGSVEEFEYFPENRIVFVSDGVGKFLSGPTVENDFKPGIKVVAFDETHPILSGIEGVTAGFPVIEDPKLLFYADVK